jgi:anti-sigma B factor antagonist
MLADVAFEEREGVSVAHVRGEVDLSNAQELSTTLRTAIQQVSAGLVLDFSQTDYLDSAGLHFIFDLGKRLRDRGQLLELVVPEGSPVESVLQIVHVESLAPMSPSLDSAVRKLREHAANIPGT